MKSSFVKKILVFLLVTVICITFLPLIACNADFSSLAEIYSADSTVRIMRNEDYEFKGDPKFDISLAKNETEGAQIIIKANKDVTFDAQIKNDLVDKDGNKIFMESVKLYAFHYIETTIATTNFPLGFYPDAIVPMDAYVAYGDNKIQKGNNQGIYLEVTTNKNTQQGVYHGAVEITLNGVSDLVPIIVTVYDFALSEQTHQWSAFNIWTASMQEMLFAGEYDCSEDMFKKYYEFLLDHRIASTYLPTHDYGDVAAYVRVVKEYALRDDVPCYSLPYEAIYKEEYFNYVLDPDAFKELMRALIVESTNELDLLKKAYIYVAYIDEPHSTTDFERVKFVDDNIQRIKSELLQEYDANGFFEGKGTLRDSLVNFRHVVTTTFDKEKKEYVDTFCPTWDKYGDAMYNYLADERVANGDNQWWYACNIPLNPYPTYHIDDNLIGTRVVSWMQKKYNVEGTLYWAVNIYKKCFNGVYGYRDIWNDPLAFPAIGTNPGCNGDGFLMYPGEKYGVDGPIGTIRLSNIRDGVEDYEYLYRLEELLLHANAKYGTTISLEDLIEPIYDRLFTGMMYNTDSTALKVAREEIAQLITALENGKNIINVTGINASSGVATVEIYTDASNTVKLNGNSLSVSCVSGNGLKYVATVSTNQDRNFANVDIYNGKTTVNVRRNVSGKVNLIADFNQSDISGNFASKFASSQDTIIHHNTDLRFVKEGIGSLKTTIIPAGTRTYIRQVSIGLTGVKNLTNCVSVSASVYNTNDKPVQLYVRLVDINNKVKEIGNFVAIPKEWTDVTINVNDFGSIDLTSIKYLRIVFPEINVDATLNTEFDVYFDNIYFTEGGK